MNLDQRQKQMEAIHRLERLLDFAEQIRDKGEVEECGGEEFGGWGC